jgi:hypothetical protein
VWARLNPAEHIRQIIVLPTDWQALLDVDINATESVNQ